MSASHGRPWVKAAVLASTPNVDALLTAYGPSDSRWARSVVVDDQLGALEAGQVPRLGRRRCRDGVGGGDIRAAGVRDVAVAGVHERGVDLVGEDQPAVAVDDGGDGVELGRLHHPARAGCTGCTAPSGGHRRRTRRRGRRGRRRSGRRRAPSRRAGSGARRKRGTSRNGMYAGTGRITGLAGRERWSMATSRPWMTSGSGTHATPAPRSSRRRRPGTSRTPPASPA